MANPVNPRPWVTPEELRKYSENQRVQQREDARLAIDIARAELDVIRHVRHRFQDADRFPEIPEQVIIAVKLLAEMYAIAAPDSVGTSGNFRSESFDDYSYSLADTASKKVDLDLSSLLDEFIDGGITPQSPVNMKLRKL